MSVDLTARRADWGFKILGAFVGTDEYVMNALRMKMRDIQNLTNVAVSKTYIDIATMLKLSIV